MVKRNVIWIASYPKSGNTWMNSVMRVAGARYGFPQESPDTYHMAKDGKLPPECPAVLPSLAGQSCSVLKTHSAYRSTGQPHQFPGLELVTAGFIHIYRNPLDVLLSYINFSRLEYKIRADNYLYKKRLFIEMLGYDKPFSYEDWLEMGIDSIPQERLDFALDYFSDNGLALSTLTPVAGSWVDNTQSWIDAGKICPGYSIRYEDCLEDPSHISKLSSLFMFNDTDVLDAVKREDKKVHRVSSEGTQQQTIFYNKMRSYYFTEYFSGSAIKRFVAVNGETLQKYGYSSIVDMA